MRDICNSVYRFYLKLWRLSYSLRTSRSIFKETLVMSDIGKKIIRRDPCKFTPENLKVSHCSKRCMDRNPEAMAGFKLRQIILLALIRHVYHDALHTA